MPTVYDDVVRISPVQDRIILDVLKNDNLGGYDAKDATISIVASPISGSASVLPAALSLPEAGSTKGSTTGSTSGGQRIVYIQVSINPLPAGQEVTFYYTVKVPGQPMPAPAAVTLVGAGKGNFYNEL